jgi:hypothetical protein
MSEHEHEPPRLTPTQRLHEVTLAALTRTPQTPEHTVGLTLNAKGDVQIEVTGRGPDLGELAASVLETFEALRAKYPRSNDTSEPTPRARR